MHCEALEKVISIARKNSKILLSPTFFEKICVRLNISSERNVDRMVFRYGRQETRVVVINSQNCAQFKCIVREGKEGIRIYEFINTLVNLLTDEIIPPSPHEKMGPTAAYYCEQGIEILEHEFLSKC